MSHPPLYGAIEAGGTKFVCAIGTSPADLREPMRIATSTPEQTLSEVISYFHAMEAQHGKLSSIGIGTFGPACLTPGAADFGNITTTPKPGWKNASLVGTLRAHFNVPYGFDTDVNAAALGELEPGGAGIGSQCLLYLTVGTGIGGGCAVGGRPIRGLIHPEMGHIRIPQAPGDAFAGCCPWHGGCLEGLASGEAMNQRWGAPAETLPLEHPAWEMEASYLGTALANFMLTLSTDRIILGGGVGQAPGLLEKVRRQVLSALAGYLAHPLAQEKVAELIVPPGQKHPSGLVGALRLAVDAFHGLGVG